MSECESRFENEMCAIQFRILHHLHCYNNNTCCGRLAECMSSRAYMPKTKRECSFVCVCVDDGCLQPYVGKHFNLFAGFRICHLRTCSTCACACRRDNHCSSTRVAHACMRRVRLYACGVLNLCLQPSVEMVTKSNQAV